MPDIAKISKSFTVVLNASTITQNDIDELKDENADFDNLTAWHNFYPHPHTGLASKAHKDHCHKSHYPLDAIKSLLVGLNQTVA